MRRAWLLVLCMSAACDAAARVEREMMPLLDGKATPVFCLADHAALPGFMPVCPDPELANEYLHPISFAAFDDGTLVWRTGEAGHFAYARATVARAALERVLDELEPQFERVPRDERRHFGPDADYRALTLRGRGGAIRFESWHDDDPQSEVVATDRGLEVRDGRSDEQLERAWPDDYRAFRNAWRAAVAKFEALRPAHGEPLDAHALELRMVELTAR
jgi:hypothetical protein